MGKNTIRQQELSEEVQEELQEAVEEKAEETQKFLRTLLTAGNLSIYSIVNYLPFAGFVTLLMLLYITNRHYAERTIRKIDKLSREVKELGWDHKSLSAELMKMSTQTEIAKRVDSLGLKERVEPPIKIEIVKEKKK
ncbi:FtsL-like putative cell division protein [Sphingobacterium faecium]|uniref:FtsL-like putative cell division protein n=1 Tax=Sphingobacterium faecium TaxID=34087 RepID=UPI002468AB2A|nr:FtsL-like putative cell division protein [Sphingobacterium faecium]MDH5827836.1 FtsL-like putative cell division protein [Sphingobacterium faecium]